MQSRVLQRLAAVGILIILLGPSLVGQNAVTDWNNIAITAARASSKPGAASPGGAILYVAYVELAVYNAVNSIKRGFEPYKYTLAAPAGASADAAAIEAAYEVLLHYLGDPTSYLLNNYLAAMASIPDGEAKSAGQLVGHNSALAMFALRNGDGLGGPSSYVPPTTLVVPVWIPTSPSPPVTPWVAQMTPFTFDDPAQFLPEPPPDLLSDTWADDYNQIKAVGGADSACAPGEKTGCRTAAQAETAVFWTDHTAWQYGRMLRSLASGLSLGDSARLFAMAYAAQADGVIGCFNAKYSYTFWRPVTAIRNGDLDGNPDTIADPGWSPFLTTPNHPEYPSAHGCVTGALAEILKGFFGTPNLHLSIDSTIPGVTSPHTFDNVHDWQTEVEYARIYAGFHYHHSVVQGVVLGHRVAQHVLTDYFRPTQ